MRTPIPIEDSHMQTQIADIIVPQTFTSYQVENSLVSSALFQSGVVAKNGLISEQLAAGATNFTVPFWADLGDTEADITSDDPTVLSTPQKIGASRQIVRKSFLHQSWSEMSLASELSGSSALQRVQDRVSAYWTRQYEKRVIATLRGVLASNVTNNFSDMVNDISGAAGNAANFSAAAVIDTAASLGDRLEDCKAIAMHSTIYAEALKEDLIQFLPGTQGSLSIPTFRGLAVILDDNLSPANGFYTTILFGPGAIGFGASAPNSGYGTEVARIPAAGNGGGQTTLHSRTNVAIHPLGFAWSDGSGASAVVSESPTIADLANGAHWTRVVSQRKSVPLAFLVSK
jgi:hypothetical protein